MNGSLLNLLLIILQTPNKCCLKRKKTNTARTCRCPSGNALGPLMWNIIINNLLHLVRGAQAFADDITLSVPYNTEYEAATARSAWCSLRLLEHIKNLARENIKKSCVLDMHFMASECKRKRGSIQYPDPLFEGVRSSTMGRDR